MSSPPPPAVSAKAAHAMLWWAAGALGAMAGAYGIVDDATLRAPLKLQALSLSASSFGERLASIGVAALIAVPVVRNAFLSRLPSVPLRRWAWVSTAVWLFVVIWRTVAVLTSAG